MLSALLREDLRETWEGEKEGSRRAAAAREHVVAGRLVAVVIFDHLPTTLRGLLEGEIDPATDDARLVEAQG